MTSYLHAHRAHEMIALLSAETPAFILPTVQTVRISIQWTTKYGQSCNRRCTNKRFETLTSYESALLNHGIISTSLSLILPPVNGALDFRLVLKRRADILSTDYDFCIKYLFSNCYVMIR